MIAHLRGREAALEPFGWTGRQAEWIVLACLHSGVFTRAQLSAYLRIDRWQALRFVRAEVPPVAVPLPMLDPRAIGGPWSWGILRNQGDGFIVSGAGGSPPWARWGRTVLYSRLHCSTSTVASGSV